jgi:putative ABC transport system substrate-binding protein
MKRREFVGGLGSAAAWSLALRAQQPERMRRVGVLMRLVVDDVEGKARLAAFLHGLQELGWMEGRNVRIETRWATSGAEVRMHAAELAAVAPEVILSGWRRNRGSVGTNDRRTDCVHAGP